MVFDDIPVGTLFTCTRYISDPNCKHYLKLDNNNVVMFDKELDNTGKIVKFKHVDGNLYYKSTFEYVGGVKMVKNN